MAYTQVETTDTLNEGRVKINNGFGQTLNSATSGSDGIYPTVSLHQIPVMNSGSTAFEFLNYGKMAEQTDLDRLALPKGLAVINWSVNLVNNWQWDEAQQRAEPFDTDFPMIGFELGGEGVLCHYTAPGSIPATAFHEINRFGGGVEGLSGVNSLTTTVPFNQFKACIYAAYSSTTTPPAATDESWWGGTGNTLSSVLNPLLWLNTEEVKGSGYNTNELARFSAYDDSAYPAINFESSRGTYQTKTIVATDTIHGRIGSNVYDGSSFENTAAIAFVTRGTMANQAVGQSINFLTSATDTSGLSTRVEITHEGTLKTYVPIRYETGSVTGVPVYSAASSISPAINGSTLVNIAPVSTSSGGINVVGFTNVTASGIPVAIRGIHGHTSPTAPAVIIIGSKHNGSTNFTDLASTEIVFQLRNNATVITEVLASGNTGFGVTTPTALIHIKAGTATAGTAPIKFTTGTNTTAAVAGQMEYNNTFHLTNSDGTRRHVTLCASATKTTAAAPYTNDGYITVNIGGTDVKLMTTA